MSVEKTKTPVGLCKIAIIVLGIVVMGVGLHSHFESPWKEYKWYRICNAPTARKCPDISLENYYVAMIIICFILSLASFAATILADMSSKTIKMVDLGYHGISAILLLIAAIVFMVSASQISKIYNAKGMLKGEKIAAGILTLFQTALYAVTAFLIAKS